MKLQSFFTGRLGAQSLGVLAGLLLLASTVVAQQPADTILHNGKILTVDKNFTIAEAIAVRGNQIAAAKRRAHRQSPRGHGAFRPFAHPTRQGSRRLT